MVANIPPPVSTGGLYLGPPMDAARSEPRAKFIGERPDDARAEELSNLRLALATFALQLDAFEWRVRSSGALRAGHKPARSGHAGLKVSQAPEGKQ